MAHDVARRFTRARIRELDDKTRRGEDLTEADIRDWQQIMDAYRRTSPTSQVWIVEGQEHLTKDLEKAVDDEWDNWYATPLADLVSPRLEPRIHIPVRAIQTPAGCRTSRARQPRRRRRARAPGRPDDPDLEDSEGTR